MEDLRERLLSDENIYLAIFQLSSYIQHVELLDKDDLNLLEKLKDPFNLLDIKSTIIQVRASIERVLASEDEFFSCNVFFKPKKKSESGEISFRPLHVSNLIDQLAMISMLQVLVYQKNEDGALESSVLNDKIPDHFYGNIISTDGRHLFFPWTYQYKEYLKKADELRNQVKFNIPELLWDGVASLETKAEDKIEETKDEKEYKAEIKLDLENFFPTINPNVIFEIITSYLAEKYSNDDLSLIKKIIRKLLIVRLDTLSDTERKWYLDGFKNREDISAISKIDFAIGLPQGLPHTYFFANILMVDVASKYEENFDGEMIFYVDDSIIFCNEVMDNETLAKKVSTLNASIEALEDSKVEECINKLGKEQSSLLEPNTVGILPKDYTFKNLHVHIHGANGDGSKSSVHVISQTNCKNLSDLSYELTKINCQIKSFNCAEEENLIFSKVETFKSYVESQLSWLSENDILKPRFMSLDKFLKLREMILESKKDHDFKTYILQNIFPFITLDQKLDDFGVKRETVKNEFFDELYNGILLYKVELVLKNYFDDIPFRNRFINTLNALNSAIYGENQEHSYLKKSWSRFTTLSATYAPKYSRYDSLKEHLTAHLATVTSQSDDKKVEYFIQLSAAAYNPDSDLVDSRDLFEKLELGDCYSLSSYVRESNNEIERMILNASFSILFGFELEGKINFEELTSKLSLAKLLTYVILRKNKFDISCDVPSLKSLASTKLNTLCDDSFLELIKLYVYTDNRFDYIKSLIYLNLLFNEYKNQHTGSSAYGPLMSIDAVSISKNALKLLDIFSIFSSKEISFIHLHEACYLISMLKLSVKDISDNIEEKLEEITDYCKERKYIFSKESEQIVKSVFKDEKVFYKEIKDKCDGNKLLKSLLRLANALDTINYQNSALAFSNTDNLDNKDKFNLLSQVLTSRCEIKSEYTFDCVESNLFANPITQNIKICVDVLFDKSNKLKSPCSFSNQISCEKNSDKTTNLPVVNGLFVNDKCNECNFLCKWFMTRNESFIKELNAFKDYCNETQGSLYKTKIEFTVSSVAANDLKDKSLKDLVKYVN